MIAKLISSARNGRSQPQNRSNTQRCLNWKSRETEKKSEHLLLIADRIRLRILRT